MNAIEVRKHAYVDALRGYAIFGVLAVHATQWVAPSSKVMIRALECGARGVQLFYIASAFTLCMSWQARAQQERQPVRNFYLRRLFRVLPMFYVAIALYLALHGFAPRFWAPNGIAWWFVPVYALCLHGFHPETVSSLVPGGWSIAVEMTFYLILPLFFRMLTSLPALLATTVGAFALQQLSAFVIPKLLGPAYPPDQQHLADSFSYLSIFGQLPVFAIGLLTYYAYAHRLSWSRILPAAALTIAVLVGVLAAQEPPLLTRLRGYLPVSVVLACFVLLLANAQRGMLANPLMAWLGRLSYSMYLLHFAVLELLHALLGGSWLFQRGDLQSVLFVLVALVVTALFSSATYACIELPGIALGRRLVSRLEQRSAANLPATTRDRDRHPV